MTRSMSVVVVDDHHHVLPDIHLAIRQRRLPFSGIHVLHVDAHPDLSFPSAMATDEIFRPETLYDLLDDSIAGIAEFQLPLVFAGHVNQITWLKPSWATQMPTGAFKHLSVGKRKANGAMGVTSELPHFVEDELFCAVDDMEEGSIRTWDLFATESGADATAVSTEAISNARLNSKGFVLDIDLDYFSTWDPFWKDLEARIGKAAVKNVAQVFSSLRYQLAPLETMAATQRNCERKAFCKLIERLKVADAHEDDAKRKLEWTQIANDLTLQYAEGVNAEENLLNFAKLLEKYRDDKAIRSEIWAAGPYLNLPHHESSQEEIARMVAELEQFLHTNALDVTNPPAIVTIAKSTGDQYLPPHQLDVVLSSVLQMLERVYGKLATKFVEYEPVEDAGTKREM